ncbi:MAG: SusD/RagB family nutrient-binding outer membrane lipoprotein [Muribaculaceae bacterium]|nr:SusD/RagB family nutrient-binding outer membrane lipoprotein [Muribaculaceae bacterium]
MKKIFLFTAAAGLLALSSCNLDINDDPNYPSGGSVTVDLMFPAVENSVADAVGDQMFNYAGFFSQYFEQLPEANQYNDIAELHLDESSNLFDRCYRNLYAGAMADIEDILSRDNNTSDIFACKVLRAYCFQLLVDNIDQAPYTEALQGSANSQPKWDLGKDIFEGVLKEMDEAEKNLTGEVMDVTDPMLKKNLDQWKGFANALRLRIYVRLIAAGVDAAGYQAKALALVKGNKFFTGDVAWDVFSNSEGQYNPWYQANFKRLANNHVAAYPIVSYYLATNDPRIAYAINVNEADAKYVGQMPGGKIPSKTWNGDWKNKDVSSIKGSPAMTMPIYLFTQSELQFLIAEIQLKYGNNAAAAKEAYEAAVKADFASRGVAGADAFLAGNAVNWDKATDKAKLIAMQKWAALFYRNHMEAWSEIRRTDVPATSEYSAEEIFKSPTLYTAGDMIVPATNYIVAGGLCKRVPYPETARQLNNNTPAAKLLSDRVFWDVK